eukprot:TRINITY_DN5302_c0_g3_i4.p1 TRINITY_DN5302_c0_g3~~TRINITY_DN5302_c0_g3_i4.p1  ORF type:complete len:561 (-),score=120.24 TRINITY_DN5302_c0_g3_i4:28-1563(-)
MRAPHRAAVAALAAIGVAAAVAAGAAARRLQCKVTIVAGALAAPTRRGAWPSTPSPCAPPTFASLRRPPALAAAFTRSTTCLATPALPPTLAPTASTGRSTRSCGRSWRTACGWRRRATRTRRRRCRWTWPSARRTIRFGRRRAPSNSSATWIRSAGGSCPRGRRRCPFSLPTRKSGARAPRVRSGGRCRRCLQGPTACSPELASRWAALTDPNTTYEKAMAVADEALAALAVGKYQGVPYAEVSVIQMARHAGMSVEELAMEVGTFFGGPQMFNMNVLGITTELVRSLATHHMVLPAGGPAKAMVVPVAGVGAARKRSGMASIVARMVKEAKDAGVRVYPGHRAISVRRVGECDAYDTDEPVSGPPLAIEFSNGATAITHRLFLNVDKRNLLALGAASEPIKSASADVRRRVDGMQVIGGSKMYCFWPRAWWLTDLALSRGSGHGEQPAVHDTRYHDGPVQCGDPTDFATCKGGLLVSYEFGDPTGVASGLYAANQADAPYTPLSTADAN